MKGLLKIAVFSLISGPLAKMPVKSYEDPKWSDWLVQC